MFMLSHAVDINPKGVEPELSVDDVWRGLAMKAENALPFVKVMERCDVLEKGDGWLLREIEFGGDVFQEKITLYPPLQVHFERVGGGGFIENTISTSDSGLLLTFTFGLVFPGVEPGSDEERDKGEGMRDAYINAVTSTLSRVREMKLAGEL